MRSTYNYHISEGSGLFESWFLGEGTVVLPKHAHIWKAGTNNKIKYLNRDGEVIPEDCPYVLTYTTTDGNPIDHEWEGDFIQSFNDFGTVLFAGPIDYIYLSETHTLQSITIPNGTLSLPSDAFNNCFNLLSVIIPESVSEIGSSAFYFCSSLTDITYLGSVELCENALFGGIELTTMPAAYIQCNDGQMPIRNELKYTTTDEYPITPYNTGYTASTYDNGLGIIELYFSQTYLPSGAFESCTSLKTIELSNRITEIGSQAFAYCSSLETVGLGKKIERLSDEAFYECTSLKSITIPENVVYIGRSSFGMCSALKEIIIPDNITSIEPNTFQYCSALTSVTIGNGVTEIGQQAFADCTSLTSVALGSNITTIHVIAFYNCSSLTSITIPNSVTSIGDSAFWGCRSLTSITIPNSVTNIGAYAFDGCSGLNSITCEATTPPILYLGNDLSNVQVVYVPAESVEAYKTATNWSYYSDIIQAIL